MSKLEKNMEEIFDIEPSKVEQLPVVSEVPTPKSRVPVDSLDKDLQTDYDTVRENYEDVIIKGKDAIDELMSIARESEHPRAYEVVAKLIDAVSNANEKLIDLQKKMRDMTGQTSKAPGVAVENAIFVGSTSELLKTIKQHRNAQ
jgi:hypothetical protein